MKNTTYIILLFLQLCLLLPGSLQAQQNRVAIENDLRRLNESLSFANELVMAFGNRQARQIIQDAKRSMDKAVAQFRKNQLTRSGYFIEQSYKSIALAMRITLKLAGGSLLDRFSDLIRQAEQAIENCENKEAERLLKQAKKNQQMAIAAYRTQMTRETFEYYRIGTFLAKRAISLCDIKSKNIQDQFYEEKNRFQHLLQTAEKLLSDNPLRNAELLVRQAQKQARYAVRAFESKKYKQSLEHYYKATRVLLRAIDLCESKVNNSNVSIEAKTQNELNSLNEFIDSIKDNFSDTKNKRAKVLFQKALQLQKQAQQAYAAGRFRLAFRKSEMARNAIRRALYKLDSNDAGLNEDIEKKISALENEIKDVEKLVTDSGNREAIKFITLSKHYFKKTVRAFEKKRYNFALEGILLCTRLMNFAEGIALTQEKEDIDKTEITKRLKEYEALFADTRSDIEASNNKYAISLLKQSRDLYKQSRSALKADQLIFAKNVLELAFVLHKRSLKAIR